MTIYLFTRLLLFAAQALALAMAITSWTYYKQSNQRLFLGFLAYVLLTEVLGLVLSDNDVAVYNTFTIISGYTYLYWFYLTIQRQKLVLILIAVFTLSLGYSFFFLNFTQGLWLEALMVISASLLLCCLVYYYELLNSIKVIQYQKLQQFWISTGILVFYLGFLPLIVFQRYFIKVIPGEYQIAITVLNVALYGLIAYSFLCLKKK